MLDNSNSHKSEKILVTICLTCRLNELFRGGLVVLHTNTILSSAILKMHRSPPFCQLAYPKTGC